MNDKQIIHNLSLAIPKDKEINISTKEKSKNKNPNFYMIGKGTMNKHGIQSIDLLKEMVSLSKPAQNTIIWLKDNLYWENETGEVKIEMKNFTNSEQQQFQKGFKELKSKNLMRRTKRSHYMMNPNALIPLNYDKAIVLWRSLEILEKKEK